MKNDSEIIEHLGLRRRKLFVRLHLFRSAVAVLFIFGVCNFSHRLDLCSLSRNMLNSFTFPVQTDIASSTRLYELGQRKSRRGLKYNCRLRVPGILSRERAAWQQPKLKWKVLFVNVFMARSSRMCQPRNENIEPRTRETSKQANGILYETLT